MSDDERRAGQWAFVAVMAVAVVLAALWLAYGDGASAIREAITPMWMR